MDLNKENFLVSQLHAQGYVAGGISNLSARAGSSEDTKTRGKGFPTQFVWRLCRAKFYESQIIRYALQHCGQYTNHDTLLKNQSTITYIP